jgi:hypothetical protein
MAGHTELSKGAVRKLQRLIDMTVKHGAAYYEAQAELNDWCREHYGVEPGDVDADGIIDAVFGGCGIPVGMSADAFDGEMRNRIGA